MQWKTENQIPESFSDYSLYVPVSIRLFSVKEETSTYSRSFRPMSRCNPLHHRSA